MRTPLPVFTLALAGLTVAGCAVGPNYHSPAAVAGAAGPFVSATGAAPTPDAPPAEWWRLYQDPVLDGLPTSFSTPEINVACAEGEAPRLVEQAVALADFAAPAQVNTIDGLRVDWPDGFGLMRSSNTTPVLVLRFEGHSDAALHRIEQDMLALLHKVKPDAQLGASAH